jgi:hypothetical protein
VLIDELLKTALGLLVDNIMASDFIVKSPHHSVLKIEVEIEIDFAVLVGVTPDRRWRRLSSPARLAQPIDRRGLVETNHMRGIDQYRRFDGRYGGSLHCWSRRRRLVRGARRRRLGSGRESGRIVDDSRRFLRQRLLRPKDIAGGQQKCRRRNCPSGKSPLIYRPAECRHCAYIAAFDFGRPLQLGRQLLTDRQYIIIG